MRGYGHTGLNMLLAAPITAILILLGQYGPALLFFILVTYWSSLADVDVHLDEYEKFNYSSTKLIHKPYVFVTRIALRLNNLFGKRTSTNKIRPVQIEGYKMKHRGMTHTVWWALAVGISVSLLAIVIGGITVGTIILTGYESIAMEVYNEGSQYGHPAVMFAVLFLAGFLSVIFHSLGDIVTPSGVGFLHPYDSTSIDRFRFDNDFANRSVLFFGNTGAATAFAAPLLYIQGFIPLLYVVAVLGILYIIFFPVWLLLPRTRIGDWILWIYDGIRR